MAIANGAEFISEDSWCLGRWEDCLEAAIQDREIGRRIVSQDRVAWGSFGEANALAGMGRLQEALRVGQEAFALAERIGESRVAIWILATVSSVEADLGDLEAARTHAEDTVRRGEAIGQLVMRAEAYRAFTHVALERGDEESALEKMLECLREGGATDNRIHALLLGPSTARVLVRLGRLDEAGALIERTLEMAREAKSEHAEGHLWLADAERLVATGAKEAAILKFTDAISSLEELGTRMSLARAHEARGRVHASSGDRESARRDLSRARELYEVCGAALRLRGLEQELSRA